MPGNTKFNVSVAFDKKVSLSHVASSRLQKEKGGQKTKRTLGVTKKHAERGVPLLHWDEETDPIAKTVRLALKEVSIAYVIKANIWLDKAVDKKSPCYKHIMNHEMRHVKIWQNGIKKYTKDMIKLVEDATEPKMSTPIVVKLSKAKALRAASYNKINAAMIEAFDIYGKKISEDSRKIHTPAELKKTNEMCQMYLL